MEVGNKRAERASACRLVTSGAAGLGAVGYTQKDYFGNKLSNYSDSLVTLLVQHFLLLQLCPSQSAIEFSIGLFGRFVLFTRFIRVHTACFSFDLLTLR